MDVLYLVAALMEHFLEGSAFFKDLVNYHSEESICNLVLIWVNVLMFQRSKPFKEMFH